MVEITIRKAPGKWSVRSGGAVLGESANALELIEGDLDPVIYFPRSDIGMAFLDRTDAVTHCPHKGDAAHFSIVNKSSVTENAAWSFENPVSAMLELRDHMAFYQTETVKVEQI